MATPLSDEIRALIAYANETTEADDTKLGDCVKTLVDGYNGGSNVPSSPLVIPTGALSSRLASLLAYANETTGAGDTLVGDAIRTLCDGYGADDPIPDEYESIIGLGSTAASTYIPTNVTIDSQTNYDLLFSTQKHVSTSGLPVFGIRRASGTDDRNSAYVYLKNNTTWSGIAIGHGGVDTSFIAASAFASMFSGNMQKLSKRGKMYYNWDRQIASIDVDFDDTDGVKAVFGNLAKSNTARYNTAAAYVNFFGLVVYDDNMRVVQDYRPVRRKSDNKVGIFDVKSQTFFASVGSWSVVNYDVASIKILGQCNNSENTQTNKSTQSYNYYNGWGVYVNDTLRDFVIEHTEVGITNTGTTNASGMTWPYKYTVQCSEYNASWHGNTSWFSNEKWSDGDFFPLLYVSTDKTSEMLNVYRLVGASPDAISEVRLIQKIHYPRTTKWYFNNYYGMAGVNTVVHTGYLINSYNTESDNTTYAQILPLPSPFVGDVEIDESQALSEVYDLGFFSTTQDGYWTGKYLGIPQSNGSSVGAFKVWELTPNNTPSTPAPVYTVSGLHASSSGYFLGSMEIETIKYCPFENRFMMMMEPISSGRSNWLDYAPLLDYVETRQL